MGPTLFYRILLTFRLKMGISEIFSEIFSVPHTIVMKLSSCCINLKAKDDIYDLA